MSAETRRLESPLSVHARLVENGSRGLDALYLAILSNAFPTTDKHENWELRSFRQILGWILYSQSHLTRQILLDFEAVNTFESVPWLPTLSLQGVEKNSYGHVVSTLQPLAALISGTKGGDVFVFLLHSSFREFLVDKSRSHQFCIGSGTEHHLSLASSCLRVMDQQLHFNMANLQNSYVLNSDVPDFAARVQAGVSQALLYSCVNWARHIQMSFVPEEEFTELEMVFKVTQELFLFWVEVLALHKLSLEAEWSMLFVKSWCKV